MKQYHQPTSKILCFLHIEFCNKEIGGNFHTTASIFIQKLESGKFTGAIIAPTLVKMHSKLTEKDDMLTLEKLIITTGKKVSSRFIEKVLSREN